MRPYIIQSIMDHAKAKYPNECCGLVIQNSRKQQYIRCRNTAPSPTEQFSMHPEDYAEAEDIGTIIAIVHSHPDATTQPSQLDIAQCDLSHVPWIIVSWPEATFVPLCRLRGLSPCSVARSSMVFGIVTPLSVTGIGWSVILISLILNAQMAGGIVAKICI
ncbi:hypothetical protein XBI1_1290007 [Xenorhabdus bovienii str. Intermedium]|uniref:MPN domain-containing protein n=1 Tax=Xenorhabdus bovienii str. Intermedium TaxID=1379677 RepID=A0A077Q4U3_XENBV|nr:hypothetical protein XBI1_1290007 [Xenorhabdus bovienii str. Intermedium]